MHLTLQKKLQEMFDKAVSGVIRQGCQAVTEQGACVYYHKETGNRCAVGLMVSEKTAKKLMENKVGALREWEDEYYTRKLLQELEVKTPIEWDFMKTLQNAHDNWDTENPMSFIEHFIREAEHIAETYNLDTKVLQRSH